jgi:organic radical activating enzyme
MIPCSLEYYTQGEKQVLLDREIHKNEFKLRLLMTDDCNYSCAFCLNDFQPKPALGKQRYLRLETGQAAIITYAAHVKGKYPLQVYFSGGEPTLNPTLTQMVQVAKHHGCRTTLCTNGSYTGAIYDTFFASHIDCMHFGVYFKSEELALRIKRANGSVQCVRSTRDPYVDSSFIQFYANYGLPIKVFGDLHESPEAYEEFARQLALEFPTVNLSFRFTGVQENRGLGCHNCDRYCVTLKGAWVFPDGSVSHCPQKCKGRIYHPKTKDDWREAMREIEFAHSTWDHSLQNNY